jgi:IS5 family transposase
MIGKIDKTPQLNIFEVPLIQFINMKHELVELSRQIDWEAIEKQFSVYYTDFGRPSVPIRKMIGSILLKQIYSESDESFVDRWVENPYWQYFCGEYSFQKNKPFDPSEFVHFRKRIGKEGAQALLKISIQLFGKELVMDDVYIDTTVQEKNVTFPTDSKLYRKVIAQSRNIAKRECIGLRQSYIRKEKALMLKMRFYRHPKRKKEARAATRKLHTIAGRLSREVQRHLQAKGNTSYADFFATAQAILSQTRNSTHKVYSLHEPHVKCIAKGKEHKAYEFGNKSSIVLSRQGIIVGAMAFKENLYDGDTLHPQLQQVQQLTGQLPQTGIVDRGYRGRKNILGVNILTPKPLGVNASAYQKTKMRKRFRGRAGIEPIIGHLKQDHRLSRNFLSGVLGDEINTLLAAAAFNMKKFLNRVKARIRNLLWQLNNFVVDLWKRFQFFIPIINCQTY